MSEWAMKRFWTDVSVEGEPDGYSVRLDGRPVFTPAKRKLVVPTREIADRIVDEWQAQARKVDPTTMPWTRSANAALDKVATQRAEVMAHLAGYASTDLLCYRADGPDALIHRQTEVWDPILEWLSHRFDVRLLVTSGVMPVVQDASDVERLARAMEPMSDFRLTGFHDLVALSGSYGIALAASERAFPEAELWSASRLDEEWQIEQWGEDEEASRAAERKRADFLHAAELFHAA